MIKLLRRKLLILTAIVGIGIGFGAFSRSTSEHVVDESGIDPTVEEITKVLNQSLLASFHSERFVEPGVAFYNTDRTRASYLIEYTDYGRSVIPETDIVLSAAKELHRIDLCFMERVTSLDSNSLIYSRYDGSPHFTDDYFYTSCPIIVDDVNIGYVDVLIYIKPFGLLPNYNFVILAAHNISHLLEDYK